MYNSFPQMKEDTPRIYHLAMGLIKNSTMLQIFT